MVIFIASAPTTHADISNLGFDIRLPKAADVLLPGLFDDLCLIEVVSDPTTGNLVVTATIDTQKMDWGLPSRQISRSQFTDYRDTQRQAVKFTSQDVVWISGVAVTSVPVRPVSGGYLYAWFADIPAEELSGLGYYGLFTRIAELTGKAIRKGYDHRSTMDWITVPAQQIKWERQMAEIISANQLLIEDVQQMIFMALDETGMRVKAATRSVIRGGSVIPENPSTYHFGAKHPVVIWLTAPNSDLPFAVVATTADSWLDPNAVVAFGDHAYASN